MDNWDGRTERRSMNNEILQLTLEVKNLSQRFDNELGSANGGNDGSVKKHIRKIQEDINEIRGVVVGDGQVAGISEKVNIMKNALNDHIFWDRWLFSAIISGQLVSIYQMMTR